MGLKIKLKILDNLIWIILLILIIVNAFITPKFLTYNNIVNIFYHTSVLGFLVLAQGLCLISGNFDLSMESVMAFAPAIAILMMTKWVPGFNPILAIVVVLLVGAAIGLINGLFVIKVGIPPFLQTLSMLIILRGLVYFLIPMSIFRLSSKFIFLGSARAIFNIPVAVIVVLAFVYIMHVMLTRSTFGRSVLSIGGNLRASYVSGINTDRVLIAVFIISGVLAAFAGLLAVGRQASITNAMGEGLVFMAFAGSVMGGVNMRGGIGTALGMLGGLLVLGVIDNSLTLLGVNVYLVYATKGILIFAAVFLDNTKTRMREGLLYREEVRKFKINR